MSITATAETIEALKHADPIPGLDETILRRWSPRAFADRPVSAADMKELFEAARWAASSFNEQPWRFLVGRKGDPTYSRIFESLAAFNQTWAKNAPVLMLSAGKKEVLPKRQSKSLRAARHWRCHRQPCAPGDCVGTSYALDGRI
jgi:nitroreductase